VEVGRGVDGVPGVAHVAEDVALLHLLAGPEARRPVGQVGVEVLDPGGVLDLDGAAG
jgi:hypothetical protein